tara:strand:- start:537 stop:743 length:207 start_codon:yes stop_codon:yes gene_type:complete
MNPMGNNILDLSSVRNKVKDSIGMDILSMPDFDFVHGLQIMLYPFESIFFITLYLKHVIKHFTIEEFF